MKKLKPWQIVLLIIFYPVGIIYLIVYLCKKKNGGSDNQTAAPARKVKDDTVFVSENSKVYHSVPDCCDMVCDAVSEKEAIKRGLRRCKKCFKN